MVPAPHTPATIAASLPNARTGSDVSYSCVLRGCQLLAFVLCLVAGCCVLLGGGCWAVRVCAPWNKPGTVLSVTATWTRNVCASVHDRVIGVAVNLARYVPNPETGWILEGAQQSWGCAEPHTRACFKRLRDSETKPRPSLLAGRSGVAHISATGGSVDTRRTVLAGSKQ